MATDSCRRGGKTEGRIKPNESIRRRRQLGLQYDFRATVSRK